MAVPSSRTASRLAGAAAALVALCALFYRPASADRVSDWNLDLDALKSEIVRIHPQPFGNRYTGLTEAHFDSATGMVRASIPSWSDARVSLEVCRLVGLLRDGHSLGIPVGPGCGITRPAGVRLRALEDGLIVGSARLEWSRFVGRRVRHIGRRPALDVQVAVAPLAGADNPISARERVAFPCLFPEGLHALGMLDHPDTLDLGLDDGRGGEEWVHIPAPTVEANQLDEILSSPTFEVRSAGMSASPGMPVALYRKNAERAWWYEYLPEERLLFFEFRAVEARDQGRSFASFVREMFHTADSLGARAMVVDLRWNSGGNNSVVQPLIHGLIRRDSLNQTGRFFTLVGPQTFSAAMNTADWLEEHTQTVFVGEPTGGRPNAYGDAQMVELPHSHMRVLISNLFWPAADPRDTRPWIAPHVPAPMTVADWLSGMDPAMDVVRALLREGTPAQQIARAAHAGGEVAAKAAWARVHSQFPDRWGRTLEDDLQAEGVKMWRAGQRETAAVVYRVNVAAYPASASAHLTLGEALRAMDHKEEAGQSYRKALDLDPDNRAAREGLRRLSEQK